MNVTSSQLEQIRQKASGMRHQAIALYRANRADAATQALPLLIDATALESLLRQHSIEPLPPPKPIERTEEQEKARRMYDWTYTVRANPLAPAPLTAREEKRRRKEMIEPQALFNF